MAETRRDNLISTQSDTPTTSASSRRPRVAPEPRVARSARVRRRVDHAPEEEGHDCLAEHREQEAERCRGHRGPLGPRLPQDAAHARGALRLCCFARGFEEWCREVSTGPVQGEAVASGIVALRSAAGLHKCSIT